jgi:hypothetical protein
VADEQWVALTSPLEVRGFWLVIWISPVSIPK